MDTIFEYHRHPRTEERKANPPAKAADFRKTNDSNVIVRLNNRFGLRVTLTVGTMWCAYVFALIAIVALPSAIHQGIFYVVVWISSSFLQLVLLPIIIVGQNIQANAADRRSEDTYNDAEAVLHEAVQIQAHLQAQDELMTRILTHLESLGAGAA